jgi:hypothetical protein
MVTKEDEMDDKFLHEMRREPRPEYAANLRAKLARQDPRPGWLGFAWPAFRLTPALAGAMAVAVIGLLFVFPSVRAWAQTFLDSFRVRTFTAVNVDEDRIKALDSPELDLKHLIGDQFETLKEPGPPQSFPTPEAAGAMAGIQVHQPAALPPGYSLASVHVRGEAATRVTGSTARLGRLMESLQIRDVPLPTSLDGQTATLRVPPMVRLTYVNGVRTVEFFQGRSPEVSLPAGVDLALLGEIGLRIIGIERAEAHRLAQSIDWHGTMVVPVPADARSFRAVDVRGQRGLLIESPQNRTGSDGRKRRDNVVMWSEGESVYAIHGPLEAVSLLEMANSVR